MKTSIKNKLLFLFLLSLFVALTLSLSFHFFLFRPYYLKFVENRLFSVFLLLESQLDVENFEVMVGEIDFHQQVGVIIADESFEEAFFPHLISDETRENLISELRNLIDVEGIDLDQSYICLELAETHKNGVEQLDRMVFIKKFSNGSYCILSHPLETLDSSINAMNQFHVVAGVVACLFGVLVTLFFAESFTKPIIAINNATQQMSKLDFQQKINHNSQDELGQLSNNINILSNSLDNYKTALKKEIAFQKILSQNMSHELKTPISVIKGYLEAISYGIAAKKGKQEAYVSLVLHECKQMTELIDQMLELSQLTNALEHPFEKKCFSSIAFAVSIKNQHGNLLLQHDISFVENIPELELWGNCELLVQGFGNFVTNAVKYGDGNQIVFEIREEKEHHLYSLFNTGATLPSDELTKIFDVFYMVDKARSREKNSHGLGLTLSKSVAELHQGSVFCENSADGITFYLKIPRATSPNHSPPSSL